MGLASSTSSRTAFSILLFLLAASLVPQVHWVVQPRDELVAQTLYEDAFYYFQTSRSVALGEGSASAGGIAHNGYHPLWMVLCSGAFSLFPQDSVSAIRLVLCMGLLFGALASLAVFRILREWGCSPWACLLGAACFHLNPWMAELTISGLEAPLNALLLALTLLQVMRVISGAPAPSPPLFAFVILGLLFGLVYLVRTDNVFFLAGTWFLLAWRFRGRKEHVVGLLTAFCLGLLTVAPWTLWNLKEFGSVLQGSASALPEVRRIVFFTENPDAKALDFTMHRLFLFLSWFPAVLYYSGLGSLWYPAILAWIAPRFIPRSGGDEEERENPVRRALVQLLPLAFSVLCLGFAHKFVRLATREWYYVASDLLLALLWGLFVHSVLRSAPLVLKSLDPDRVRRATLLVLILAVAVFLGGKSVGHWKERKARPRAYALELVDAIESLPDLAPGELVGATDSGTIGFFCRYPAVNLDGVVNPEAADAIREGALLDYAEKMGIRYLLITPRMQNQAILGDGYSTRLKPYERLSPSEGFRLVE